MGSPYVRELWGKRIHVFHGVIQKVSFEFFFGILNWDGLHHFDTSPQPHDFFGTQMEHTAPPF